MGGILTLMSQHPIISSLGIVLTFVAAWGAGYLKGHRHGEESEMDRRYNSAISLDIRNEQLREKVVDLMTENSQLRKKNASMAGKLGMTNTAPGTNSKETG